MLGFTLRSLALLAAVTMATTTAGAQYTLPPLPYAYDALEPAISKEIMTLHHDRHHRAYVENLNRATAEFGQAFAAQDLKKQIALQSSIKFNGGGHINHSLFWLNLTPAKTSSYPSAGPLKTTVDSQFGSLDDLKSTMTNNALAIQGSGWSWLIYHPSNKTMEVVSTANQDPILAPSAPLLGIDVWEHAYYLDYQNNKATYLEKIWTVINWKTVEQRLVDAQQNKA